MYDLVFILFQHNKTAINIMNGQLVSCLAQTILKFIYIKPK